MSDWRWRDTIFCLLLAGAAVLLFGRVGDALSYQWNWSAAWSYVMATDDGWQSGLLLSGLAASVRLLILSGVLAVCLGGLTAALALSSARCLRWLAAVYVESLRNLPPIVFMFIFFFFAGVGLFDFLGEWASQPVAGEWLRWLAGDAVRVENFIGGALCLAIFESAFFAEIFRAGVLSVDNGQRDAARSMGLSRWQTQLLVIWPQMFRNIAAPLAGQFILLIKDSAILSVISVQELTFSAQEAAVSSGRIFEMWLLATGFYFALCWPLLWLAEKWSRRNGMELAQRLLG